MMAKDEMNASREDYLEAILMLRRSKGSCISVDVANFLGYSKPSVSNAVKKLEAGGLLYRDEGGELLLTDEGREIAEKVLERHGMLKSMFIALGVSEETAEKDACGIEHILSDETLTLLKEHLKDKL